MRYLPIFQTVRARPCLVVGGGPVARRKADMLLRAGARVTVVAPRAVAEIRALHADAALTLVARRFAADDVAGQTLVFSATGIDAVDRQVSAAARAAGVPVAVVDAPALSDFIMPSIVDRSPVVVAVSTGGAAPVLARQIRAAIEALLPADLGRLAEAAEALRAAVKARIPGVGERRRFWDGFFRSWRTGGLLTRNTATGGKAKAALLDRTLAPGHVAIVGAGPGDPELLTLKALQRLQDADVIVHDRLVGPRVLDYARRDAETVDVGKAPGRHSYSQAEINALLAHHAGTGRRVVRLKGGDPFIFGRGGEERAYLSARGIAVEIVPGITAALGCAAEAGIPLTHRGAAQSVTYLTGASGGAVPDYDWQALARLAGTLVFYMGVGTADAIAAKLIGGGLAANTPVAVIENGTREARRTVTGRLGALADLVGDNAVGSPALLVIGAVVAEADAAARIAPQIDPALASAS